MIKTGIDEISFVFLSNSDISLLEWDNYAKRFIASVIEKLDLNVLGEIEESPLSFAGYNKVYYPVSKEAVFLAYNDMTPRMGIFLKFSASGLRHFIAFKSKSKSYKVYNLARDFFDMRNLYRGEARVSKIDLTVDCYDEGIYTSDFYDELNSKKIEIFNASGRRNNSKYSAVVTDGKADTIYVGSRKSKSMALLRIYNKQKEQLDNKGEYLSLALKCANWSRFEASFRKEYARQIGPELTRINTPEELSRYVYHYFCERYCFYENGELTMLSKYMKTMAGSDYNSLVSETTLDSTLEGTAKYLIESSGLSSFLYKIKLIYGKEAFDDFLKLLNYYMAHNYSPNDVVNTFINTKADMLKQDYSKTKRYPWTDLKNYFDNVQK